MILYSNAAVVLLPLISFFLGRTTSFVEGLCSERSLRLLSYLLLVFLGWKAGLVLAEIPRMVSLLMVGLVGCSLQVFLALKMCNGIGRERATALAAHLGSISITTYLAAECFMGQLSGNQVTLAPVALGLELPPVLLAILLGTKEGMSGSQIIGRSIKHVIQPLVVGVLTAAVWQLYGGLEFLPDAIKLAQWLLLVCFLSLAGSRAKATQSLQISVVVRALSIALMGGVSAALMGSALLPCGKEELFLLAVLCGSSSYIAAPAALRGLGIQDSTDWATSISLGYIFPFNLLLGVPLYWWLASLIS